MMISGSGRLISGSIAGASGLCSGKFATGDYPRADGALTMKSIVSSTSDVTARSHRARSSNVSTPPVIAASATWPPPPPSPPVTAAMLCRREWAVTQFVLSFDTCTVAVIAEPVRTICTVTSLYLPISMASLVAFRPSVSAWYRLPVSVCMAIASNLVRQLSLPDGSGLRREVNTWTAPDERLFDPRRGVVVVANPRLDGLSAGRELAQREPPRGPVAHAIARVRMLVLDISGDVPCARIAVV